MQDEIIGNCEGCSKPIGANEPAASAEDVLLCAECAPTYREMLADPGLFLNTSTREQMTADEAEDICYAHLKRGGALDDKVLSPNSPK